MKKRRNRNEFLEELRRFSNITRACEKTNLSRQSIYRWMETDKKFREDVTNAIDMGGESISDLAENKLVSAINRGEAWAIRFFLSHRNKHYKPKKPMSDFEQNFVPIKTIIHEPLTAEDIQRMRDEDRDINY